MNDVVILGGARTAMAEYNGAFAKLTENALGVWNEKRTLQAGYVPAEVAPEVPHDWQAVSLWEFSGEGGQRIGLRVLLAPPDAWIGLPRA